MKPIPRDFAPHYRKSPVTDPWEPLYSRRCTNQLGSAIELYFEVQAAHCNARGFLHGGVLASLCDNAMGHSLGVTIDNPNANIVTLNLTLDYLGSAQVGDPVLIEPRVIRAGNSIGVCDTLVKTGDRIIARANATFSVRIVSKA